MDQSTEEIRQRADIVEIVNQYVALRPAGNSRWKACCPFHDEKTPSFYVTADKGFYKCFGCGAGGDVFSFVQRIENVTFPEAKERLAQRYGIQITPHRQDPEVETERQLLRKVLSAADAFFQQQLSHDDGWPAQDYARERGLTETTIKKFGLGYAPDAWDKLRNYLHKNQKFGLADTTKAGLLIEREREGKFSYYDRFRHRLMFPIRDTGGHVVAFGGRILSDADTDSGQAKYINSPEGPLFKKSAILYALPLARQEIGKKKAVIITEGYMDAIALHEAGFENTVATLGTALTTQHVGLLRRLAPDVVYLCFDGDSAGMKAALRSAPLFAAHNLDVRVVSLPAEDDPDTFIKSKGNAAFEKALQEALLLAQYELQQSVDGYDWEVLAERKNAVNSGAKVIAEVASATEREAYIQWLAARWARAEKITEPGRMQRLEEAVAGEVRQIIHRAQKRQRPQENAPPPPPEEASEEDIAAEKVQQNATGKVAKGVLEAQKSLLGVMLNNPSWRGHISEHMPEQHWTEEPFREFAKVLSSPQAAQWSFAQVQEELPDELQSLLTDLVMSPDAQKMPSVEVVNDWMARVEWHWSRLYEKEVLADLREKLDNNEPVSDSEKDALLDAFRAMHRIAEAPESISN